MMRHSFDAARARNPVPARKAEIEYAGKLKKIAKHVGDIINGFPVGDPSALPTITAILRRYSDTLHDWAVATASSMLADVERRDAKAWADRSREMGRALRDEIRNAPTGEAMRGLLAEQVDLIKSIPREAADRVHRLTLEGIENGARASEIAAEIMESGKVAKSRAVTIARTEVARTASTLTEARAKHIGSDGYIWRTADDSDVRHSHKEMNGKFVRWDSPPTLDGMKGHAGCFPNCRCYPDPVIPE